MASIAKTFIEEIEGSLSGATDLGWLADDEVLKQIFTEVESDSSEFDPEQLKMGIQVEQEHLQQSLPSQLRNKLAEIIARAHLREIKDYYTRLKEMENNAKGA